ncbi:MAG: superoxide dismutase [Alphaproteobacteria bacterium]|nr:MAG: superoxide dismutase [Alphaproteobacteria bacterium]
MFILPDLPYDYEALEPAVSSETLHFHHDKHHKKYVDTLNQLLSEQGAKPAALEEVVLNSSGKLFNQAGQAWNHGFFWESMTPDYQPPSEELAALREAFLKEGEGHFASGWVWIVAEGGQLKVISTHDADTALKHGVSPIIVCDLWEHAYYLDYQNNRRGFLEAFFDKAANWPFAEKQLRASKGEGEPYRYPAPEASA